MRLAVILSAVAILSLISAGPGAASSVGDLIDQARSHYLAGELDKSVLTMQQAADLIWQKAPLWVGEAVLVQKQAAGYGIFEPRRNNVYAHNEPILLYVEPMGFRHRQLENGKYQFGVSVDFLVKLPSGKVLGGQTDIESIVMESRKAQKELFLSLAYSITGAPPGKYVIETIIHDIITKQSTSIENTVVFR